MRLRKHEWKVAPIAYPMASQLVQRFHYAKKLGNSPVALHGLFMAQDIYCALPYGVCSWQIPVGQDAAKSFHEDWKNVLALSRMVLTPDAPKNAASFMLSRSIKLLPERYHTLCTYADEWQNHTGRVYLACNWQYLGLSFAQHVWVSQDEEMISDYNHTHAELLAKGHTLIGKYKKHRYVYYRHEPSTVKQLSLFDFVQE